MVLRRVHPLLFLAFFDRFVRSYKALSLIFFTSFSSLTLDLRLLQVTLNLPPQETVRTTLT